MRENFVPFRMYGSDFYPDKDSPADLTDTGNSNEDGTWAVYIRSWDNQCQGSEPLVIPPSYSKERVQKFCDEMAKHLKKGCRIIATRCGYKECCEAVSQG